MIGSIYRIQHLQSDIYYVGMTTNTLTKRWASYKADYNKDNNSKISIYPYMIEHGIQNFKISLIKEYEVCDRNHLKVYETLWINKLNPINKVASFNPIFKGKNFRTRFNNSYYQKNQDHIKQQVKKYADDNPELIKARTKIYRSKNKEQIALNKAKCISCECGGTWSKGHGFPRHEKTKKHQHYLKDLQG